MSDERFDVGAGIRREVFGDEYVKRSEAERSEFTDDFRRLGTEYAWAPSGHVPASTAGREARSRSRPWAARVLITIRTR